MAGRGSKHLDRYVRLSAPCARTLTRIGHATVDQEAREIVGSAHVPRGSAALSRSFLGIGRPRTATPNQSGLRLRSQLEPFCDCLLKSSGPDPPVWTNCPSGFGHDEMPNKVGSRPARPSIRCDDLARDSGGRSEAGQAKVRI